MVDEEKTVEGVVEIVCVRFVVGAEGGRRLLQSLELRPDYTCQLQQRIPEPLIPAKKFRFSSASQSEEVGQNDNSLLTVAICVGGLFFMDDKIERKSIPGWACQLSLIRLVTLNTAGSTI